MILSIASATFYHVPFRETLELIKKSGFEYIELDIYWKGGDNWEAGQHLKDIKPKEVLKMVKDSGLKISSLHDIGGVIYNDSDSLIAADTYQYLDYGYKDIPCIVFHTPHKKTDNAEWWKSYKRKAIDDLSALKDSFIVCIENMPYFNGYQVPLVAPKEMLEFANECEIFVNIDTTHYAEIGMGIVDAAEVLKSHTKSIHLSDYKDGKRHLYIGEGELDFLNFFDKIWLENLHSVTLECNIPYEHGNPDISVESMKDAHRYLKNIITSASANRRN